jgi:hypothetical protein
MKRNLFLALFILSFSTPTFIYAQETATKQQLVGSLIFFSLESSGPLNDSEKLESEKADKINKDLILTFESNGKYIVWNKKTGKNDPTIMIDKN